MTEEQMQFLAKAATDSYFSNMNVNEKASLMQRQTDYMNAYFRFFNIALEELKKVEEKKQSNSFKPFGEDELKPILK